MNKKETLILSIIIFLTALFWLISDIYHIAKTKRTDLTSQEDFNLQLINYKIEKSNLDILKEKEY